jgi:PAS domain S-box-containing protein
MLTDDQLRAIRAASTDDEAFGQLVQLIADIQETAYRAGSASLQHIGHESAISHMSEPDQPQNTHALHVAQEYQQTLLAALPDIVLYFDREGNYRYAGGRTDMLILPPEDLIGKHIRDMLPESLAQKAMQHLARALETGSVQTYEHQIHIGGALRSLENRVVPVQDTGVLVLVRDITADREQAETALQQARDIAEAADHTRATFLRTISHEIRTPLNAMLGMTALLLDTELTLEQRELTEVIRIGGKSLQDLMNDILDLSRIEAGIELDNQPFDLRQCVEEAIDLVSPQAGEQQLDLAYFVEDYVPTIIFGDAARLRQVLVNLLGNAIKFTEQGEVVLHITSHQPAAIPAPSDKTHTPPVADVPGKYTIQITIRDTGIGISPDQIERLFQAFSQIDHPTSPRNRGSGLGLAISKQLVELMGGQIELESKPGAGSVFRITFQSEILPDRAGRYPPGQQLLLTNRRVLLIDKDTTSQAMLVRRLESWGMRVDRAGTVAEAIEQIEQGQPFDILILYVRLASSEDIHRLAQMSMGSEHKVAPLILLTPLGTRSIIEQQARQFVTGILTRPIKPPHLYALLVDICTGHATQPRGVHSQPPLDEHMAQHHPLRILVAEDHPVNQRVALLFLERLGYLADVATNGQEVLSMMRAVQPQPYDVILMDVQMPYMNGIETTQHIRAEWPADQQPAIIALSAHMQEDDRAHYQRAGLDGYISKSVRLEELAATLQQCQPLDRSGQSTEHLARKQTPEPTTALAIPPKLDFAPQEPAAEPAENEQPIDMRVLELLQARIGTDSQQKLAELISIFLDHTFNFFAQLEQASQQGDMTALSYIAHTLKSSSANLGAQQLSTYCKALENASHSNNLEQAAEQAAQVLAELHRVHTALQAIRDTTESPT